jgi:hypothetical protein
MVTTLMLILNDNFVNKKNRLFCLKKRYIKTLNTRAGNRESERLTIQ